MSRHGIYSKKVTPLTRLKRRWNRFSKLSKKKKAAIILAPILAFLIIVPIGTYIFYYNDIADKERLMNRNNTGIVLTDKDGAPFFTVGRAEHRNEVALDQISPHLKKALIASEDKDFYKHEGFSITGIARALSFAGSRGGGSTITQQLAKNTLLTEKQTILRKYQELTISLAIEQRYSKDEILSMYLNSVFFGGTNFGIEEAAKFYFNKAPKDLDLAESAMLIGILPAPNAYSPTLGNATYAKQRQTTVLGRMVTTGVITEAEKQAALAQPLAYAEPESSESGKAPHFAEMVLKQLYDKYGEEKVLRSGYQVKTTLDSKMQAQLNENIQGHIGYIQSRGGTNAAGMAIDPKTGEIRALVGSADYANEQFGKVNMATTKRQPGSSFKTIYYTEALAQGVITPATILKDEAINLGGYTPKNADGRFRGDVTVRQSISQSLNIPSVKVMQKLGIDESVAAAKRFGITAIDSKQDYGLALALGAAEAPLDQMTNAYATLANGGSRYPTTSINEIKDKYSKSIFTANENATEVVSKEAAFLISNILSDNTARAPIFGGSLTVAGHTAAVKTGTTDNLRDAWTIGYTPEVAVGVWVGNNDNTVMMSGGSDMAGPIWRGTMNDYLAGKPDSKFAVPSGVIQRTVCRGSDALADKPGLNTFNEYFMTLHVPTGNCQSEQKPVMIQVCRLADKKVIELDEKEFNSATYSKDLERCKKVTIEVCELDTQEVISIDEEDFDETKHSKDIADCETPPEDDDPETPTPTLPLPRTR